jgi:hypothetical protein
MVACKTNLLLRESRAGVFYPATAEGQIPQIFQGVRHTDRCHRYTLQDVAAVGILAGPEKFTRAAAPLSGWSFAKG